MIRAAFRILLKGGQTIYIVKFQGGGGGGGANIQQGPPPPPKKNLNDTLDKLIRISSEGPDLNMFDFDHAVSVWAARRLSI